MLLERAFGLVQDARAARIPTDAAVWNALVTAAGQGIGRVGSRDVT